MASYGGQDFTSFRGVNTKSSIAMRFAADVSGNESTLSVKASLDGPRAFVFPDKSGTFGVTGTFVAQLPAVTSTSSMFSTVVTVAGIRAEDGLVVSLQGGTSATYGTATTAKIFYSATPGNGNITLNFMNLGASTGYTEVVMGYTTVR